MLNRGFSLFISIFDITIEHFVGTLYSIVILSFYLDIMKQYIFFLLLEYKKRRKKNKIISQEHSFTLFPTASAYHGLDSGVSSCMMNGTYLKVSRRLVDIVFCFLHEVLYDDPCERLSNSCWHAARSFCLEEVLWSTCYFAAEGGLPFPLLLSLSRPLLMFPSIMLDENFVMVLTVILTFIIPCL